MKIFEFKNKSIRNSLLISIGLVFAISVILFIAYLIFDQSNKKQTELKNAMDNDIKLIAITNIVNLWNFDMEGMDQNLSTFLKQKEIISIELKDSQNKTVIKKENPKIGTSMITRQMDLIRENNKIGSVEVLFTNYYIVKDINEILFQFLIAGPLVLLIILFFLYYLTGRIIVKPIQMITEGARRFSVGDIELKGMDWDIIAKIVAREDELGSIGKAFTKLIEYQQEKVNIAGEIAKGNIDIKITLASEADKLGIAFKETILSLNNMMYRINSAVEQTASGSNQVAGASQALSQGATEQASSLEEITSSITEINSQAKQNSENALQANSLAKKTLENSAMGNQQMKELVSSMANITKSAEMIKKIVKVIDDIAFQTNLLALNANVEAARAGKYGKGFAVVAEEVRNLAGRSAESVKETTGMVEEAVKNIMNGNKLVDVTAKQLDEIASSANKVADLVEEIATASKEQTQGLEQINQGLGQIDQVTQANTANAEQSASAAEELSSQAQELKTMVAKFKLSEEYKIERIEDSKAGNISRILISKDKNMKKQTNMGITYRSSINREIKDPKKIIKLDDDDFGKF